MKIGDNFKIVNGMQWPASDEHCASVTFTQVDDLQYALARCRQRRVVIQAGGNAGVWPIYLAKQFDHVYTFEPEPINYACLVANVLGQSGRISTYPFALGDVKGRCKIGYPEGKQNMGAVNIHPDVGGTPIVIIDSYAWTAVDLIQLDIEGYEPQAILGGLKTIRAFHPIIMLEDKGLSEQYGYPKGWPLDILGPEGYKIITTINRDVILEAA